MRSKELIDIKDLASGPTIKENEKGASPNEDAP
jgi:hypothetical protein